LGDCEDIIQIEETREYVLRSNTSSENRKSRVPYNRDSFLLILRASFEPMIVDYEININNSQILVIQVFRIKIIIVSQESVGKNKSCMLVCMVYNGFTKNIYTSYIENTHLTLFGDGII
jgi:hypothetical protein